MNEPAGGFSDVAALESSVDLIANTTAWYISGDWVEDLLSGYMSDLDLMVVVATEEAARKDS